MAIKKIMKLLDVGTTAVAGCDISYYQGDVDFEIMKRTGIKAVIIRAGYGTTVDKRFVSYINAAIKAGLAVGVYWFLYARDTVGAINNAQKCREVIDPYKEYILLVFGLIGNTIRTDMQARCHHQRDLQSLMYLIEKWNQPDMKRASIPTRIIFSLASSGRGLWQSIHCGLPSILTVSANMRFVEEAQDHICGSTAHLLMGRHVV